MRVFCWGGFVFPKKKKTANIFEFDKLKKKIGGAGVEDYEIEQMKTRAENSLVSHQTTLGRFQPLIKKIVMNPQTFNVNNHIY